MMSITTQDYIITSSKQDMTIVGNNNGEVEEHLWLYMYVIVQSTVGYTGGYLSNPKYPPLSEGVPYK